DGHVTGVQTCALPISFESQFEDLISYELYATLRARPSNFPGARVAGLEVEAQARPHPWLSLMASYSLQRTWNLKDDPRYYLNERSEERRVGKECRSGW